jgi:hypothetical protein
MLAKRRGRDGSSSALERRLWQVTALSVGALTTAAVRGIASRAWRASMDEDPPAHPTGRDVRLRDALVWAVSLAVGAAVTRVVAERLAAAGWEKAVGSPPPDPS